MQTKTYKSGHRVEEVLMEKKLTRPTGASAHGQKSKLISLRLPLELVETIEKIAEDYGYSRSTVIYNILQNSVSQGASDG